MAWKASSTSCSCFRDGPASGQDHRPVPRQQRLKRRPRRGIGCITGQELAVPPSPTAVPSWIRSRRYRKVPSARLACHDPRSPRMPSRHPPGRGPLEPDTIRLREAGRSSRLGFSEDSPDCAVYSASSSPRRSWSGANDRRNVKRKDILAVAMAKRNRKRGRSGRRPTRRGPGTDYDSPWKELRLTITSSVAWPSFSHTSTPTSTGPAGYADARQAAPVHCPPRDARPALCGQAGQGLAQERRGSLAADPCRGPDLEGRRLPQADARLQSPDLRPL